VLPLYGAYGWQAWQDRCAACVRVHTQVRVHGSATQRLSASVADEGGAFSLSRGAAGEVMRGRQQRARTRTHARHRRDRRGWCILSLHVHKRTPVPTAMHEGAWSVGTSIGAYPRPSKARESARGGSHRPGHWGLAGAGDCRWNEVNEGPAALHLSAVVMGKQRSRPQILASHNPTHTHTATTARITLSLLNVCVDSAGKRFASSKGHQRQSNTRTCCCLLTHPHPAISEHWWALVQTHWFLVFGRTALQRQGTQSFAL
jgi:hypothetical protein